MSVLQSKRTVSKAEYVNTAIAIYTYTLNFLSRLSARYSRLMASDTIRLADELTDECEKANSIYPTDAAKSELRERHLLEARASLCALDVKLTKVYEVLCLNPSGAFETATKKEVDEKQANKRLDGLAQTLGDLINKEQALLTALINKEGKGDEPRT